jgi:protein tyrosine phosphatase
MKLTVPFPRSYWVVPGKFLAGYYPGSRDPLTAQRKLEGLLEHGIRQVINLMEEHEHNFSGETFIPYEQQLEDIAEKADIPLKLVHMPIRDTDVPTVEGMVAILDEIDRTIRQNPCVYLHCWGGRGRTGTAVACSLDLLSTLRQNDPISHLSSPETEIQAQFVRSWVKGT